MWPSSLAPCKPEHLLRLTLTVTDRGVRQATMSCGLQFWIIRQSSSVTVSCRWRIRQRPQTIENISRVRQQIFNMLKIWRRQNIRCDSVHVSLATATLISLTLTMPLKTVCSRYEVITDSQVFVGVRCQRLLTNKQREETSRAGWSEGLFSKVIKLTCKYIQLVLEHELVINTSWWKSSLIL